MERLRAALGLLIVAAIGSGGCVSSSSPATGGTGGADAGAPAPDSQGGGGTGDAPQPADSVDDGNPGTGGSAGDAADSAPADLALSACHATGTELCEDFESGAIDSKVWGMHATTGSTLTVDKGQVHGGSYALHVKLAAGSSNVAQITDAVTFPAKDNTFYTRAFFYFSPDLPADNNGGFHMALLLATGNNDLGFVEAGLASAGDKQYLGYSEYYGAGPDVHQHGPSFTEFGPRSNTRVVPGKWLCLELMQGGNATTTMRRVWVDDKELPEQVSNYTGRKPPQFSLMSIGVLQYHSTPILTDVWIDDIRVSSTRIGCAEPPAPPAP